MSAYEDTQKKFLNKIFEIGDSKNRFNIYDFGRQLNLSPEQTSSVIKDLREKGLVEDDHSKDMIQDDVPRLKIKLTEEGIKEVNKMT
jgi:Mn-dependent DtxR family transcriptional regulator